jgi:hypothetical protein
MQQHHNRPLTRLDIVEFTLGEVKYLEYLHLVEVVENQIKSKLLSGVFAKFSSTWPLDATLEVIIHMIPHLIDEDGLLYQVQCVLSHRLKDSGLDIISTRLVDGNISGAAICVIGEQS